MTTTSLKTPPHDFGQNRRNANQDFGQPVIKFSKMFSPKDTLNSVTHGIY